MTECKRMGFEILPPDVNESFSDFTAVVAEPDTFDHTRLHEKAQSLLVKLEDGRIITNRIRFGLRNVKNFGEEIGKIIIEERKKSGKFLSLEDFLERVQHRNMNKKSLEALIMCGALDSLNAERVKLLHNIDNLLEFNRSFRDRNEDQMGLFGSLDNAPTAKLKLEPFEADETDDKLAWEKELLGLYVSGHPLERYRDKLSKNGQSIRRIKTYGRKDQSVVFGAVIEEAKVILTKKQAKMAFVRLADLTGTIEMVVFPKSYEEFKDILEADKCLAVKGKVSDRNGERSIICDKLKLL
jgi:DNA polymerase-3 subunit alpha